MAKKGKFRKTKNLVQQVCHPDAAGVDLGATEFYAAVGKEKIDPTSEQSHVKIFSSFNKGIREAIEWFKEHNIKTVAMESTGNYWVALFDQLKQAGFNVCLTNASHCKALPGRKTDICDAQWIQQLHTAGLLKYSYVLEDDFQAIRYMMRFRDSLIKDGSRYIQLMQKAFVQMNVQLHHALSDIDGLSGRTMIEAILEGERDPEVLTDLRHPNCRTPRKEVIEALSGNFRDEYVFVLRKNYERWQSVRQEIYDTEMELARLLKQCDSADLAAPAIEPDEGVDPETSIKTYIINTTQSSSKHELGVCFKSEAVRIYGVDLSEIPGIGDSIVGTILAQIGGREAFLKSFTSAKRFVSWLGECPDNRKTGGNVKSSKTRKVNNPLSVALRMAALVLGHSKSHLGDFSRKMKGRLGKPEGITATAHKLARIIYAMISTGKPYDPTIGEKATEKSIKRQLKALERKAKKLGVTLDLSTVNASPG